MNKNREFNFILMCLNKNDFSQNEKLSNELKKTHPNINCYILLEESFNPENFQNKQIEMIALWPFQVHLIPNFIKLFPSLKWIHSLSAGVEKFFTIPELINNDNIIFSNSKGAYSENFGEIVMLAFLYFSYNIPTYYEAQTKKDFVKPMNENLNGKNVLIIGYGNNGICIAKRCKSFLMNVNGIVRTMRENIEGKEFLDNIKTINEMDSLISLADFVIATLPETKETINILNKSFFEKMKKNAVFVNIGRGSSVNEDDLVDILNEDKIKGAVLDVTQNEPIKKDSKLYSISKNKLFLTNHSLGVTKEYPQLGFECVKNNIFSYLENGKPKNIVNKVAQY